MNDNDDWQYDNEEEAEMGQLHAIHLNLNAVASVRQKLAEASSRTSLEECEDCGEPIPEQRQIVVKGCTKCVFCQGISERR